ncbi:MAG: peptidoglycan glycosyltransferase [Lachnospiraceae bacterium]|nr:peptidoglycan glycosyltransferase [Lachnospiraceae bacterium]
MSRKIGVRFINSNENNQRRILLVFAVMAGIMVILVGRIAYWQIAKGTEYQNAIQDQGYNSTVGSKIPFQRGTITDRNGVQLAYSSKTYNVILDPKVIKQSATYMKYTFKALEEAFGTTQEEFDAAMEQKNSNYYILYRKQPYEKIAAFKELQTSTKTEDHKFIKGVWFETEYERVYPYATAASHVIGFTNAGNVGCWGIEQQYNSYLNGTDGRVSGYYDSDLNLITNTWDAVAGDTIVSTIDLYAQQAVEKQVNTFLDTYKVNNIGVVVMDATNGEIVSMVSNRSYDLNNPRDIILMDGTSADDADMDDDDRLKALNKMWRNFCVCDTYEPGSTFKCFTVAAALEEKIVSKDSHYKCTGMTEVGGAKIRCSHSGEVNLKEAISRSCNSALIAIAEKEGAKLFYQYQMHFGFGEKTGIDLPGEAAGVMMKHTNYSDLELATQSFGQGFNVTMVQVAAAYASLVNGGYYYQPHVVRQIQNADGAIVYDANNLLVRKTVSADTSAFLQEATLLTVESGTARPAQTEGYKVGGKTGTAKKGIRDLNQFVVSFVGSVPYNNPKYIIYVVIDQIDDEKLYNSSRPATELTSKILSDILPYLGVYPDGDIHYGVEYTGIPDADEVNTADLQDLPEDGDNDNGDGDDKDPNSSDGD